MFKDTTKYAGNDYLVGFSTGQRSSALVEMVDVFPTLAGLTEGEIPPTCEGESLEQILASPEKSFREFALSLYPRGNTMGYSMRTERWRYTEWIQTESGKVVERELYDHSDSQVATLNLAGEEQYQELLGTLSQRLAAHDRLTNISGNRH